MRKSLAMLFTIVACVASAQQINYAYSGGNGAIGLTDYGIVTQANGGQALLGAEGIGDIYANLNLGSNISGTRRFWHISKRTSAENHNLNYYFFDGSTFQPRVTFASSGSVGIGTLSPTAKLEIVGSNSVIYASNYSDQDFQVWLSPPGATAKKAVIGTGTLGRFSLGVSGNEHLTIINGGNVGIGTTAPGQLLTIQGIGSLGSTFQQKIVNGTQMLALGANSLAAEVQSQGAVPLYLNYGGNNIVMNATGGNVGIGTTSPTQKLTVNGTIYGKEVKVDLSVPGPDYVFEGDYKLTPLEDIKTYIDQNKHLPEVPSAKEMEKNGIQLGDMNMLLLKKIEELTLYLLQKDKEIQDLREDLEQLKSK